MRVLAASAGSARLRSGVAVSPRPAPKDSTAMREATSPAWAPPMPSATTNSGGRASSESSLARRCIPVSLPEYCSATLSTPLRATSVHLEGEFAVADAHAVLGVQRARGLEQLLVEVRTVGGAQILDHHRAALLVDARVARGGKGVLQADLRVIAAAQHDVAVQVVDHPRFVAGRALHHEARSAAGRVHRSEAGGRVHASGVG